MGSEIWGRGRQYVLPVGLVFGGVTIDDILLDRRRHREVARLGAGLQVVADPTLDADYPERYTSVVEVQTRDGRTLTMLVAAAKGTPENPLSADEVRAKFRRLTAGVIPARRAAAILTLVDRIDRERDLRGLAALLRARVRT